MTIRNRRTAQRLALNLLPLLFIVVCFQNCSPISSVTALDEASMGPVNSTLCRYGQAYNDGCEGAPAHGIYSNPNFFTYAKQSGQVNYYSAPTQVSNHPTPWNVAGVDYPVGYPSSTVLKDPAAATLPTGCSYTATGSITGGPFVYCNHTNNLTFDGWDFSLHGCTQLQVSADSQGTITIRNSRFVNGPNCSAANSYLIAIVNPSPASFDFENNYIDGDAVDYPTSLTGMIWAEVAGSMTFRYNAILRAPARPIVSNSTGNLLLAYNYFEGFVYHQSDGHGEVVIDYFPGLTQSSQVYSFNTALEPDDVAASGGTSVWYPTGGAGATINSVQVDHNVSIVNLNAGQVTVSAASAETAYSTYGTVVFDSNYMDATGAYECFASASNPTYNSAPVFTGNINLINGRTVTGFGVCP